MKIPAFAALGADTQQKLLQFCTRSPNPDQGLNNFERLLMAVEDPASFLETLVNDPQEAEVLFILLAVSPYLAEALILRPQDWQWLKSPHIIRQPRYKKALAHELAQMLEAAASPHEQLNILRRFKKREMMRIGARDLLGLADFSESVADVSNLADIMLQKALEICEAELFSKHGIPKYEDAHGIPQDSGFTIIGMGKLGGSELNYSSDIDIMFLYSAEGETTGALEASGALSGKISNHQYYTKLAEKITRALGEPTEEGVAYRIDLRLRPEGRSGDLASSLRTYELYYESWGETWERQALIKARPVAGDMALGQDFLRIVLPFIYRKYLDYGAIAEIKAIKDRIDRSVAAGGKTYRHVKLGYGGIREIEFLVQALQLIYGGQNPWIRDANTLKALHKLAQAKLLSYEEVSSLTEAYKFLRQVEHRLQIVHQLQVHTIPQDPQAVTHLAKRLGYRAQEDRNPAEKFLADYAAHTRTVRKIYDNLFFEPSVAEARPPEEMGEFFVFFQGELEGEEIKAQLKAIGFSDQERAYRNLLLLRDGPSFAHYTARSRGLLANISSDLFLSLKKAADPDMALNNFERFSASVGARTSFFTTLSQNPQIIPLLISLLGGSEFLSHILIQHPGILDVLFRSEALERQKEKEEFARELGEILIHCSTYGEKMDALRRYKRGEELRVGLKELAGKSDVLHTIRELSALAQGCLQVAYLLAQEDTEGRYGKIYGTDASGQRTPVSFCVVGLGKLGSEELSYASDLDVVFTYSHAGESEKGLGAGEYFDKLAEVLTITLSNITQEGYAYRVDVRLRPEGVHGTLVMALPSYIQYFAERAATWERQMLVRARVIAGDKNLGRRFMEAAHAFVYGDYDPKLAAEIDHMRKRMEEERTKAQPRKVDIKLGAGGLADIEFTVQLLQLRHGKDIPELRISSTLEALEIIGRTGLLAPADFTILKRAYLFLRTLESRLRIYEDRPLSALPADPAKLEKLARRMDYTPGKRLSAGEKLLRMVKDHTAKVRDIYDKTFAGPQGTG